MKKYLLSLTALLALGCAYAFANDEKTEDHKDSNECHACKEKGSQCDHCKKAEAEHQKH